MARLCRVGIGGDEHVCVPVALASVKVGAELEGVCTGIMRRRWLPKGAKAQLRWTLVVWITRTAAITRKHHGVERSLRLCRNADASLPGGISAYSRINAS